MDTYDDINPRFSSLYAAFVTNKINKTEFEQRVIEKFKELSKHYSKEDQSLKKSLFKTYILGDKGEDLSNLLGSMINLMDVEKDAYVLTYVMEKLKDKVETLIFYRDKRSGKYLSLFEQLTFKMAKGKITAKYSWTGFVFFLSLKKYKKVYSKLKEINSKLLWENFLKYLENREDKETIRFLTLLEKESLAYSKEDDLKYFLERATSILNEKRSKKSLDDLPLFRYAKQNKGEWNKNNKIKG